MERLVFHVQGSAKSPYRVIAEGAGRTLRMFCTCPAGRRGGRFCKHAAQLLMGDVTRVTSGADSVAELLRRSASSGLSGRALVHNTEDTHDRVPGVASIDDILANFGALLEQKGWVLGRESGEGWDSLGLFSCYKNGKRQKHPKIVIRFEAVIWDTVLMPDGTLERANIRPRARPWTVRARGAGPARTWGAVDRAALAFLVAAGIDEDAVFG